MGRRVDVDDLVDAPEIAEKLGLRRPSVVHNWRRGAAKGFPQPVVEKARSVLWVWRDVEAWARKAGRLPG